ncbi:MAG: hypothetical protein A2428_05645 [Bdellovibrionales bacterium RIFOXYC1_FULL_54_43]|nr:MAG: hypothetical protein A2428_05645 [Bdellovibrionales bacterium RIFOXYC1_FULL_54_43]OFZ85522.1 MAG: hypothetical protein A2603_16980 [Bdellovibrionales bacterium RIFOXYD1_FULL_55_31]
MPKPRRTLEGSRKVIWAIDAFEPPNSLQKHAADALKHFLMREPAAVIEPVYVLSPAQLNLSVEFSSPWVAQYRPAAEKAIREICESFELPQVIRPTVIVQNFASTVQAVGALSDYAEKTGAEAIVVASHGRTGFRRILLGSFAETLILNSKVPVIVAGPFIRKNYRMDHVLLPTDFGQYSEGIFRQVVSLACALRAKLTLFHAIPSPIEPVFQSGVYLLGGSWLPVHTYFSQETERHRKHAQSWARWARRQGIATEVIIETKPKSIPDEIVALATQKKVGLVAMATQTGPVSSALIGSITRQVVRNADCPVWVLRPPVRKARAVLPRAA